MHTVPKAQPGCRCGCGCGSDCACCNPLYGKRVLITGASQGIGRATARTIVTQGGTVCGMAPHTGMQHWRHALLLLGLQAAPRGALSSCGGLTWQP